RRTPPPIPGTPIRSPTTWSSTSMDDAVGGALPASEHGARAFQRLARRRNRRLVDARGLAEIERVELALGRRDGRPRVKLATVPELLAAAKGGRRRIPG
ncbi:hypothetical protein AB0K87_12700, partial [Streptomyces sp. NPDC053705]